MPKKFSLDAPLPFCNDSGNRSLHDKLNCPRAATLDALIRREEKDDNNKLYLEALRKLREPYRSVLSMLLFEVLSFAEIAGELFKRRIIRSPIFPSQAKKMAEKAQGMITAVMVVMDENLHAKK